MSLWPSSNTIVGRPTVARAGTNIFAKSRFNQAVAWIIGGSYLPAAQIFEKDEGAKWFGFFEKTNVIRSTVYQIVETPRFSELMETCHIRKIFAAKPETAIPVSSIIRRHNWRWEINFE